jgi:hypothetical protein
MEGLTTNFQLSKWADELKLPLEGIYFKNELPLKSIPGAYIINLNDSDKGGTHWVALFISLKKKATYFDSFGVIAPVDIEDFIKTIDCDYKYSDKIIQDIDNGYCGQYCLYFIYSMHFNRDFGKFINLFDLDYKNNLEILKKNFISKLL